MSCVFDIHSLFTDGYLIHGHSLIFQGRHEQYPVCAIFIHCCRWIFNYLTLSDIPRCGEYSACIVTLWIFSSRTFTDMHRCGEYPACGIFITEGCSFHGNCQYSQVDIENILHMAYPFNCYGYSILGHSQM